MIKHYLTAESTLDNGIDLAITLLERDFIPDLLVAVWRGGASLAISIHETLKACGCDVAHTVIRASSYTGIDQQTKVELSDLDTLVQSYPGKKRVLFVDDVFDTGRTLEAIRNRIDECTEWKDADIRIATAWYKPARNQTSMRPDFWLHSTDAWLVFPHELCGLDLTEIRAEKPGITDRNRFRLLERLKKD